MKWSISWLMDRSAAIYKPVASSIEWFVQQVAVSYLSNGYFFFVQGWVPEGKDPQAVDDKLLEKYGIAISKWSRARRKRNGLANRIQRLPHSSGDN